MSIEQELISKFIDKNLNFCTSKRIADQDRGLFCEAKDQIKLGLFSQSIYLKHYLTGLESMILTSYSFLPSYGKTFMIDDGDPGFSWIGTVTRWSRGGRLYACSLSHLKRDEYSLSPYLGASQSSGEKKAVVIEAPSFQLADYCTLETTANNVNAGPSHLYQVFLGAIQLGSTTSYSLSITVGTNQEFAADGSTTYTLEIRDVDNATYAKEITTTAQSSCSGCPTRCLPILITATKNDN